MNDILKIFSIFTPKQIRICVGIFLIMFFGGVLESIGIGAIMPMLSLVSQQDYLNNHEEMAELIRFFNVTNHKELIVFSAFVLIVIYLIKNIYIIVEVYIQRSFAKYNQVCYSEKLFELYLNKTYTWHINHNTAVLLRNVNQGGIHVFHGLVFLAFSLLTELITVVAIWGMLIYIDLFTSVVVAGVLLVLVYLIVRSLRKRIAEYGKEQNDASAGYIKWVNQGLGAVKETKVLHCEKFFTTKFTNEYDKYATAVQKYSILAEIPRPIIEFIVVAGLLLLIIGKVILGENPSEIVSLLGVLALAAFRLMPSANRIVVYYNGIKNGMPFFNEIYPDLIIIRELLLNKTESSLSEHVVNMPFSKQLTVRNAQFKYEDNANNTLKGISFEIKRGDFIGIIGSSGAGKTTLVDMLLGLICPSHGEILCDDTNVNQNIRGWQSNLAYVPQDIYLLDGSIRENIAFGVPLERIDNELVTKVLRMSELIDYVDSLPKGLDTFVGERGVKLSGGQRQRIGIARALYKNPEILVLDEATSALDNDTEKAITDTLLKLKGKMTIISIAHRISTLEQCDYKIKLEDGKAEIIR